MKTPEQKTVDKLAKQEKLRAKKEIAKLKFESDYQENLNKIAALKKFAYQWCN